MKHEKLKQDLFRLLQKFFELNEKEFLDSSEMEEVIKQWYHWKNPTRISLEDLQYFFFWIFRAIDRHLSIENVVLGELNFDYYLGVLHSDSGYVKIQYAGKKPSLEEIKQEKNLHDFVWNAINQAYEFFKNSTMLQKYKFTLIHEVDKTIPAELRGEYSFDKRIFIKILESKIIVSGKYIGTESYCSSCADKDLQILFFIWQYSGFLRRNEMPKAFGKEVLCSSFKPVEFSFEVEKQKMSILTALWKKYFERFIIAPVYDINPKYYSLLSEEMDLPRLRLALVYLAESQEEHSFASMKFLNYWLAIEIMLGEKRKEKISESLKSKFSVLFNNTEDFEDLWQLRGEIVHTGKPLNLESGKLQLIEKLAKTLFSKLLAAALEG